jgi:predicted nuclease of predicted toxin-antitoxin system
MLEQLESDYPESVHVRDHGLDRAMDNEIWEFASLHGFVIVTRDADFYDRSLVSGAPPKVLWLNCGNSSSAFIVDLIMRNSTTIQNFSGDPQASCLELT